MLLIAIVEPVSARGLDSVGPMLWVIAHTEVFFLLLLVGLMMVVEFGFRLRQASRGNTPERQSLVESARNELGVLLGLLLGFTLPMALPHYEQRNQLVIDEANAITTVQARAELLAEPFRDRILSSLAEYVGTRIEFGKSTSNQVALAGSVNHAEQLQNEMWRQTTLMVQQNPNVVTSLFVQSLDKLPDLVEQRLAAEEKHIPAAIWLVMILIAALTCFVVGYGMQQRFFLGMLVVPLMVAIVLSLASELDNPRTGLVRDNQQSMQRVYVNLSRGPVPRENESEAKPGPDRGKAVVLPAENVVTRKSQPDHGDSADHR